MREISIGFYKRGYNCSQAIIKAAEQRFGIYVPPQSIDLCKGVSNGLGAGNICCALIGAVMVFGLLYNEATVKSLRIKLLDAFQQTRGSLNCSVLTKRGRDSSVCESIVGDVAELTEEIIMHYGNGRI
jgi:C_GCAxxG_C_C family probable redox protein